MWQLAINLGVVGGRLSKSVFTMDVTLKQHSPVIFMSNHTVTMTEEVAEKIDLIMFCNHP